MSIMTRTWRPKRSRRRLIRLYQKWADMRNRCINEKHRYFHIYGGKGVSVCDEWQRFSVFREWAISNGFRKGLSIDRIDGSGDYGPDNCRFATPFEQAINRVATKLNPEAALKIFRSSRSNADLAAEYGVAIKTIASV